MLVEHPNGAIGLDHVVVTTNALERTCAAIEAATGAPLRRVREVGEIRQGFHRLGGGGLIVEVVERAGLPAAPAWFWGLVINVEDLDAAAARIGPDGIGAVTDGRAARPADRHGPRRARPRRARRPDDALTAAVRSALAAGCRPCQAGPPMRPCLVVAVLGDRRRRRSRPLGAVTRRSPAARRGGAPPVGHRRPRRRRWARRPRREPTAGAARPGDVPGDRRTAPSSTAPTSGPGCAPTGAIVRVMAITSARTQPDPGVYAVYAEDLQTTSYRRATEHPRPLRGLHVRQGRGRPHRRSTPCPAYRDGTLAAAARERGDAGAVRCLLRAASAYARPTPWPSGTTSPSATRSTSSADAPSRSAPLGELAAAEAAGARHRPRRPALDVQLDHPLDGVERAAQRRAQHPLGDVRRRRPRRPPARTTPPSAAAPRARASRRGRRSAGPRGGGA